MKAILKAILPTKTYDALKKRSLAGDEVECIFCGGKFKRFLPHGTQVPILEELKVVSGGMRNTHCPNCESYDRERLIYLYILRKTDLLEGQKKILDIAPGNNLTKKLQEAPGLDYISGDLMRTDVMVKLDVTDIQFPDKTFDVILCNHIFEHVPDDHKAMTEIFRVLKPGGWAMVLVPYSMVLTETIEDPSVTSPQERERRFGQDDHIRIYALPDYLKRLQAAGLETEVARFVAEMSAEEMRRNAFIGEKDILIARRPRD